MQSFQTIKIYPRQDTLFLTDDTTPDATIVYSIAASDLAVHDKKIIQQQATPGKGRISTNSFLIGNYLIQNFLTNNTFTITLKNLSTGELLNKLSTNKDSSEIKFLNSSIYGFPTNEEYEQTLQTSVELKNIERFWEQISGRGLFVFGIIKKDTLIITTGCTEILKNNSPLLGALVSAGIASFTFFALSKTAILIPGSSSGDGINIKSVNFKTLLKLPGGGHIDNVNLGQEELENWFLKLVKEHPSLDIISHKQDLYLLGQYDKKKKVYRILEL